MSNYENSLSAPIIGTACADPMQNYKALAWLTDRVKICMINSKSGENLKNINFKWIKTEEYETFSAHTFSWCHLPGRFRGNPVHTSMPARILPLGFHPDIQRKKKIKKSHREHFKLYSLATSRKEKEKNRFR